MAISDSLAGVTVTVAVDGTPLLEHEDDDLTNDCDKGTVARYIETVAGAIFEVQMKVNKICHFEGDVLAFKIFVDGEESDNLVLEARDDGPWEWRTISQGRRVAGKKIQKHRFGDLVIDPDAATSLEDMERARTLGLVDVQVWHRMKQGARAEPEVFNAAQNTRSVSEKALKGEAVSHSACYTEVPDNAPNQTFDLLPVEGFENPVATYVFKYRSLEALKSLHVIPRTPSPTPQPQPGIPLEERVWETLTDEEIRELARRAHRPHIKRERTSQSPVRHQRRRRRVSNSVLVIDDDCEGFTEYLRSTQYHPTAMEEGEEGPEATEGNDAETLLGGS